MGWHREQAKLTATGSEEILDLHASAKLQGSLHLCIHRHPSTSPLTPPSLPEIAKLLLQAASAEQQLRNLGKGRGGEGGVAGAAESPSTRPPHEPRTREEGANLEEEGKSQGCFGSPSDLALGPSQSSTARGFEPLRAEPNGFLVHHLSHSVTLSC